MKIGEILKELQPCEYSKLQQKEIRKVKRRKREKKLNIKELMSSRYYKRGRGGAIKQVR